MSSPVFGRLLTAMVTPMDERGALDLDAAARLARHLVEQGNDGIVVNGTTGESATTSDAEKAQLVETVVDAVGDRAKVVAGVGTNDTAHTLELTAQATERGAHGLLVVTPYYTKPPQAGLLRHFRTVAEAAQVPVMLYDIPGRSGVPIATETLIALAEHERIVAVKDAKGDLWATTHVLRATDLEWYSGDDGATLPHMAQGAVGVVGVTTHVAPGAFARLVAAATEDDFATARRLHMDLVPAVDAVMGITQGAIAAKAALVEQGVLTTATVRSPLPQMEDAQLDRLRTGLKEAGLL
ncbi:4-hydroxy-tetrahydrodipicolinate synthase [Mobilicoccus pelagius]|uniref:4-hydroxy-tetrahydrodipicolinate synthase n=1 Tax=Mobilicoccus pelagius NBRC 104925 TaxID=1089455 RepID=H5UNR4_9MICO|nr:4-hydroxy-tetrahydrodipicolinate synthase [Mobilicoccus pelagius]GAB47372.1 dihydrodipicolinate synthase [Mobilicoccus pelagius NBRC 104925]